MENGDDSSSVGYNPTVFPAGVSFDKIGLLSVKTLQNITYYYKSW
jgi:hypothetical protein